MKTLNSIPRTVKLIKLLYPNAKNLKIRKCNNAWGISFYVDKIYKFTPLIYYKHG